MNEAPPHSLYLVPGIRDRRLSKAQSPLDGQVTSPCLSLPPPRPHRRAHAHTVLGTPAAKTRRTRLSSNLPGILSHNSGSDTGDPSIHPSLQPSSALPNPNPKRSAPRCLLASSSAVPSRRSRALQFPQLPASAQSLPSVGCTWCRPKPARGGTQAQSQQPSSPDTPDILDPSTLSSML